MLRRQIFFEFNRIFSLNSLNNSCKITVLLNKFHSLSQHITYHKSNVNIVKYSQTSNNILYDVLSLRDKNTNNSITDKKINELCLHYKSLPKEKKHDFVKELACKYYIQEKDVTALASTLVSEKYNVGQIIRLQEKLQKALTPKYKWLFVHIGRQENGVKFLVDMRTDVLTQLQDKNQLDDCSPAYLQQLNNTLKELLLLWFSVGFLKLERITWKSSCEMLQKISDYEAVHPVRNWADLKTRMGKDRRCFVYTHSSMPDEPIVILHTALRQEIVSSSIITKNSNNTEIQKQIDSYQPDNVKAAIFYSISSTQVGLQGIELGNYLIKRVATELTKEYPKLSQFSSLSPIPKFRNWFFDILKRANNDDNFSKLYFTQQELESLAEVLKTTNVYKELIKQLSSNNWLQIQNLVTLLEPIMMRNCVRYLYMEKKRGYALDSVANFHLRNGAEMWRINWLADLSARGLSTSCGIMINYRYYLDKTDENSKKYIETKKIVISSLVENLVKKNHLC